MRSYITYGRVDPMPNCRYCKERMPYWVLGLPNEKHIHDKCLVKQFADEIKALQEQWLKEQEATR